MFDNIGKNNPTLVSSSEISSDTSSDDYNSKMKSKSAAGATPFHRRTSYFPRDPETPRFKWLIYDNNGSFNGWFDWLPLWMRVGYWSPLVVISIIMCYTAIIYYKPQLEFETTAIRNEEDVYFLSMPKATVIDLSIFLWGIIVIAHGRISLGSLGAFPISFTGWSWILLTARAGFDYMSWILAASNTSLYWTTKLATVGSSIRLATLINAFVVCSIWNFILLPIIAFKSVPKGEKRTQFLKFNFGFFMTNIHVLNFPLACMNIVYGERLRLFTVSDLWVAYAVTLSYSLLYLFVMDRLGLHFYPIFNPRTSFATVSLCAVLGLFYFLFLKSNEYLSSIL